MKILCRALFVAFFAILIPSIALAAGGKARTVSITGVVQDEQGKPAANVIVEAPYWAHRYSTQTGADGKFSLEVELGPQRFPETKLTVPLHAKTRDGAMQAFRPGYGQEDQDKPLVLMPARELPVVVNDAEGQPVADAKILVDASYTQVAEAMSDAAGKATLRVPANATLQSIIATKADAGLDYFLFWTRKEPHSDPYRLEQDFKGPVTFTLNGMTKVAVLVTDEQGKPLAGVMVYPWLFEKPKKGGRRESFRVVILLAGD